MGSWVKTKGWLKNYVPPRPAAESDSEKIAIQEEPEETEKYGVTWKARKCPHCGSRDFETTKTVRQSGEVLRYHKCKVCKKNFKSREID